MPYVKYQPLPFLLNFYFFFSTHYFNTFEYGDIMLLQMKAKDTDSFTGMAIRLVFKEFWNEIK